MKRHDHPPWLWGFCWAMVPAVVAACLLGSYLEPTHAIAIERKPARESGVISALSTSDALRIDRQALEIGALLQGDEVQAELVVRNIWDRKLPLAVDLVGLPGWQARLESATLGPGEWTRLYLTGTAGEPGELDGRLRITALQEFLVVQVKVIGQIAARPAPAPEALAPEAPAPEAPAPEAPAPEAPAPEAPAPEAPAPEAPAPEAPAPEAPAPEAPAPVVQIELMPKAPLPALRPGER